MDHHSPLITSCTLAMASESSVPKKKMSVIGPKRPFYLGSTSLFTLRKCECKVLKENEKGGKLVNLLRSAPRTLLLSDIFVLYRLVPGLLQILAI